MLPLLSPFRPSPGLPVTITLSSNELTFNRQDSFRRLTFGDTLKKENRIHINLDGFPGKTYLAIHDFATISSGVNPQLAQLGSALAAQGDRLLIYTPYGLSDHELSGIDPQLGDERKLSFTFYQGLPLAIPLTRWTL